MKYQSRYDATKHLWENRESLYKYLAKLKQLMYERRSNLQTNHPVELLIREVVHEIEKLGAHEVLTNAVVKLEEVRNLVGDYIDWHPELQAPSPNSAGRLQGDEGWPTEQETEKAIEENCKGEVPAFYFLVGIEWLKDWLKQRAHAVTNQLPSDQWNSLTPEFKKKWMEYLADNKGRVWVI